MVEAWVTEPAGNGTHLLVEVRLQERATVLQYLPLQPQLTSCVQKELVTIPFVAV